VFVARLSEGLSRGHVIESKAQPVLVICPHLDQAVKWTVASCVIDLLAQTVDRFAVDMS
jgi:hypothetical protein